MNNPLRPDFTVGDSVEINWDTSVGAVVGTVRTQATSALRLQVDHQAVARLRSGDMVSIAATTPRVWIPTRVISMETRWRTAVQGVRRAPSTLVLSRGADAADLRRRVRFQRVPSDLRVAVVGAQRSTEGAAVSIGASGLVVQSASRAPDSVDVSIRLWLPMGRVDLTGIVLRRWVVAGVAGDESRHAAAVAFTGQAVGATMVVAYVSQILGGGRQPALAAGT